MENLSKLRAILLVSVLLIAVSSTIAQEKFTIEQIISPAYPFDLVSAKKTDRIAWIEYERGMRNVYTAAAPDFKPVRLTDFMEDDGNDLSSLSISDDGSIILFVRGHAPNRQGWVANPVSDPDGSERAVWAISTNGGNPWRVAEGGNPVLSPDGNHALIVKIGQIYSEIVSRRS